MAALSDIVRVLVVEDFETFRRFVCSTLAKNPNLRIVGEASEGIEAVRKAEELRVHNCSGTSQDAIPATRRIPPFNAGGSDCRNPVSSFAEAFAHPPA